MNRLEAPVGAMLLSNPLNWFRLRPAPPGFGKDKIVPENEASFVMTFLVPIDTGSCSLFLLEDCYPDLLSSGLPRFYTLVPAGPSRKMVRQGGLLIRASF